MCLVHASGIWGVQEHHTNLWWQPCCRTLTCHMVVDLMSDGASMPARLSSSLHKAKNAIMKAQPLWLPRILMISKGSHLQTPLTLMLGLKFPIHELTGGHTDTTVIREKEQPNALSPGGFSKIRSLNQYQDSRRTIKMHLRCTRSTDIFWNRLFQVTFPWHWPGWPHFVYQGQKGHTTSCQKKNKRKKIPL